MKMKLILYDEPKSSVLLEMSSSCRKFSYLFIKLKLILCRGVIFYTPNVVDPAIIPPGRQWDTLMCSCRELMSPNMSGQ